MRNKKYCYWTILLFITLLASTGVYAGESDIHIPDLTTVKFDGLGGIKGETLMYLGIVICFIGAAFGLFQYKQTKALPVHESMAKVSHSIWETCKTYLFTQGKFLAILWLLIAACMVYYFKVLQGNTTGNVVVILLASILGILGSSGQRSLLIVFCRPAVSRPGGSEPRGVNALELNGYHGWAWAGGIMPGCNAS